jgi:hypothetical protein
MLELRRDLTAELIWAHDADAPVIDGTPHRRVLRAADVHDRGGAGDCRWSPGTA